MNIILTEDTNSKLSDNIKLNSDITKIIELNSDVENKNTDYKTKIIQNICHLKRIKKIRL